ncbi:rhodanese-like domain-containing protein [Seongchinamella unica]|uniref:Rhodanese-like domain-containing protein n=1 Tax=Seongchinamella unica TaxID=2547392 RepID=A0A4R5LPI6_9GAMM|nr:rhodanese-like domain-containing protein [Seongchinamella unica]TDG12462.1 rhodanese-like domain-containing protein [Seongchinamella unica]
MARFPGLLLALALLVGSAVSGAQSGGDSLIIDTRSPAEYEAGHVDDAVLIPYDAIEAGIVKLTEDKNTTIYLYCGSGRRAEIARERLLHRGYTNVTNLGGLDDAEAFFSDPK